MILNATDVKNNFGRMLKMLDYEDVIVKKNGRAVAKIVKYSEPLDPHGTIKENIPEYIPEDRKVSYEEFLKFTADNDKRYELIDGDIYLMASPKTTHQQIVGYFHGEFYKHFEGQACSPFISPYDITLEVDQKINVLQPDLGVICDLEEHNNENDQYMGVPALVIEVLSKSSRSKDSVRKLNLYMLSGVKEYWIVDPMYENTKVYRFEDYEISEYAEYPKGSTVRSMLFEGLEVTW